MRWWSILACAGQLFATLPPPPCLDGLRGSGLIYQQCQILQGLRRRARQKRLRWTREDVLLSESRTRFSKLDDHFDNPAVKGFVMSTLHRHRPRLESSVLLLASCASQLSANRERFAGGEWLHKVGVHDDSHRHDPTRQFLIRTVDIMKGRGR